ncbi:RNA polymerase sigma-70 factor [Paenibacillus hexagrammi]|uniref:RNA polymerase sigma-70 factor n=1 Tax=Paenibacillus hexagrammi TaxID=2908839 RepID=A0ABY3SR36_9BACL|nr:RNA polymerase sigma-70 factor [Paenibacillus sp. YPD9-1]UJF35446.1 RNA polymerase sigma-70 factor [Paenibacillus sp. YPD9-1]
MELDTVYHSYRPLLLSIAYRMLGSVTYAEDLVQDVFVTIQQQSIHKEGSAVQNLKAYLCKIVTNRCLDYLKSARHQREVYVGPWLPEPLLHAYSDSSSAAAATAEDPLQTIVLEDSISYAFLVLLDRLTPIERAVFVLREAFEYDYSDIADFVNKTEQSCRKTYSRLKRKIQQESPVDLIPSKQSEQLVLSFLQATATGDMGRLLSLLSEDIVLYSDGGGKVYAAIKPIISVHRVLAFIQGLASKDGGMGSVSLVTINGQLGVILRTPSEPIPTVVSFAVKDDRIQEMYVIRNPDKLRHLNL